MHRRLIYSILITCVVSISASSQDTGVYPDSLRSLVLKIEPLSFVSDQISGGIEVSLPGNKFLDVTMGYGGIGISDYLERSNGFLLKVGIKFPKKFQTPYSMIYFMPLFAYSNYNTIDYSNYPNNTLNVSAQAILLDFGYRHISPQSRFYYDIGIDVGYGWANGPEATRNFNHVILTSYDYNQNSVSGIALSMHASIGILLKKKSK